MSLSVVYEPRGKAREYGNLAVNLYSGGCPHACSYCYVADTLHKKRENWDAEPCKPKANILERLEKDLVKLAGDPSMERRHIFLCFTCDPYPKGVDTATTLEAIHLIHGYGFHVKLLTKGAVAARRDLPVLRLADQFGVTLTFDNPIDSRAWEPNADKPTDRIRTLQLAHERGCKTWVSLEPVIKPEQTLMLIELTCRFADYYAIGCWNHDARAKAIDWPKFGRDAANLLDSLGKPYYLKADLRAKMEAQP